MAKTNILKFPLILILCLLIMFVARGWDNVEVLSAQANTKPILVVVNDNSTNKFGRYLAEILMAEGLNSFNLVDISTLSLSLIEAYPLTLLAETPLTAEQVDILTSYVGTGGRIIAMRPDPQIADVVGLGNSLGTQTNGYIKMSGTGPSMGLSTQTLQFHGTADLYTTSSGATQLAQLYSDATTDTPYPAVIRSADGQGVAFTYDLATTVIYMRQGNPANADTDLDNDGVFRTIELFTGSAGNPPWVDLDRTHIPQADEQQRLLARLIKEMLDPVMPVPQLWYFPGTAKTIMVATSDAHANPLPIHQNLIDMMNAYDGDVTIYFSISGGISEADLQVWRMQGHTFGIHPYAYREDTYEPYDVDNLQEGFDIFTSWFGMAFTSPMSRTVRNHQVAWAGWTDAADYAVSKGLGLDTNFYTWGSWLERPDGTWARGYVTGSGQPMKFIRADGTVVPYFQQLTTLIDEQLVEDVSFEDLTPAQAVEVSKQLIDSSLAGDYAAIMTQFHVDYFYAASSWVNGTLAYAQEQSVPIWNADRWLTFTETRHDAQYSNITWNTTSRTLTFDLDTAATDVDLTTVLPLMYGANRLNTVSVDGSRVNYTIQTVKGHQVVFVTTDAGSHSFKVAYIQSLPDAFPLPSYHQSTPTLTWARITWALNYDIQISQDASFAAGPIYSDQTDQTFYTVTTPLEDGTWYWRVRAMSATGSGAWSTVEQFTLDLE